MKIAFRLSSLLTVVAASFVLFTSSAHAATLNVVAGTDAIEENSQCQLSEAIQNINDQAVTNADCAAGDGNNDTINLPVGTVTLSSSLPAIERSVTVQGQGLTQSVINGGTALGKVMQALAGTLRVSDLRIMSFHDEAINSVGLSNLVVERVEIDAGTMQVGSDDINGLGFYGSANDASRSMLLRDVYIHDISSNGVAADSVIGISVNNSNNAEFDIILDRVTVSAITNNNARAVGISLSSTSNLTPSVMNASITNSTVSNITSDANGAAVGLAMAAFVIGGDVEINVESKNLLVSDIRGFYDALYGGEGAAVALAGAAGQPTDNTNITYESTNNLLTDGIQQCLSANLNPIINGQGQQNLSISSLGGNISDDASCNDYFTHPTDQNNVNPADLNLGTLGDYGGSVPTIPLGAGSIAIDSGVTVPGLTTDARGVSRPQCAAFDSGAYEYNDTCPEPSNGQTLTYPDSEKGTTVSLVLPSDVTNPSVSAVDPDSIPKDGDNKFPAGLTSFQFTTTPGATKAVTLYYDLPGNPSDYTARKYKTNTQTFIDVPNASITREDYNGKSMLKLTYSITDGGILDQDGLANGTVIDPVGLATTSLASTGENLYVYFASIMTLLGAGVWMSRKMLQP